jgi:UDP-GlcNAc:undecaprenyl-phosphate GlcNAc-1-phosphate transferase
MDTNLLLICLIVVALAAVVSYAMSFISRGVAKKVGAIDEPKGTKKIHRLPTPLFGGLGIFVVGGVGMALLAKMGWLAPALGTTQLLGFGLGALILLVVGLIDDRWPLSPRVLFPLYVLACVCVVVGGTSVRHLTNPAGGVFSLVAQQWNFFGGALSFAWPADVLTIGWLLILLFSTKLMDGLDGLVSGQASIGAAIILLLCLLPAYHLPAVALLSALMLGCYLGFLPANLFPAKQFLGESGSTLAGFVLGFLAIASGAKLATAFMALGVALIDVALVIFGRMRRHVPITQGDRTHLHHQLLDAGFTQRRAVGILWAIGLIFGLAALALQTRGKLLLFALLVVVTISLSIYATRQSKRA